MLRDLEMEGEISVGVIDRCVYVWREWRVWSGYEIFGQIDAIGFLG